MMHILLIILKIIGIVLLAVLGFLLLLLLLALFCPVAYSGKFMRTAGRMSGSVTVTWLFRLVWVSAFYDNGERGFRIRLLGIPLDAAGRLLARRRGGKKKGPGDGQGSGVEKNGGHGEGSSDIKEGKSQCVGQRRGIGKKETIGSTETSGTAEITGRPEKKPCILVRLWRRIVSFFQKLISLPGRILRAIRGFFQKIKDILQKIDRFRELLCSEEFLNAFGLVRGSVGKLVRHVRPRKIRGYLKFGFDDPYYTGLCLGAVSVVYPWYCKALKVEPDFQHKALEADLYLRGRVFGVYALYILIKIYFDKNVKYIMNRFRDKEAQ